MKDKPFHAGGALLADSPVYVRRQADESAQFHLENMEYITLIETRQQGKTSLINQMIGHFQPLGYVFAYADLTTFDQTDEASWYCSLCDWLLSHIDFIPPDVYPKLPTDRNTWRNFLRELACAAKTRNRNLVLLLDEVGGTPSSWATGFFSTIRSIYSSRQIMPFFKNMTFIVAGAHNPKELIKDSKTSDFNSSHRIPLDDFSIDQVRQLVGHISRCDDEQIVTERLHYWAAGQPYITQRLCLYLAEQAELVTTNSVDTAVKRFFREDTNRLPRLLEDLETKPELVDHARRFITKRTNFTPGLDKWQFELAHIIGVITRDQDGRCCIRNRIYEQAFPFLSQNTSAIPKSDLGSTAPKGNAPSSDLPKEERKEMNSIPANLDGPLRKALLDSGFFDNDQFQAIFANELLTPFQTNLPGGGRTPISRVSQTTNYLIKRKHKNGQNALVLFLRVLTDGTWVDPDDECYGRLVKLADELELALSGISPSLHAFGRDIQQQISQGEIQPAIDRLQDYLIASGATDLESKPADTVYEITAIEGEGFEKILGLNNFRQIAWIQQGIQVAKSVCRVLIQGKGLGAGTGFLIAPDLLITNHHVIRDKAVAESAVIEFNYQQDFAGNVSMPCRYKLDTTHFRTNPKLDYTLIGVQADPTKPSLDSWGHLLLNPYADPVPGEHVIIIQHPNGGLKQIVVHENYVVNLWDHRLQYSTDTMPGSSGSPVFNDLWQVIAIHHAGGDLRTDDKGGRRYINEGILMSAIRADAGDLWPE